MFKSPTTNQISDSHRQKVAINEVESMNVNQTNHGIRQTRMMASMFAIIIMEMS